MVVTDEQVREVMRELGKRGGLKRAANLTQAQRQQIAAKGGKAGAGKPKRRPKT